MNLQTMTRLVELDLNVMLEEAEIWNAISEALRFHRFRARGFNVQPFSFLLATGVSLYKPGEGVGAGVTGIPRLFVRTVGDLELGETTAFTKRSPLPNVTSKVLRELDTFAGDVGRLTTTGISGYAILGRDIWISPVPRSSEQAVRGEAILDPGAFRSEYDADAGDWRFFDEDGVTPIDGNWTCPWLQHEPAMIRYKAEELLYSTRLDDEAGAARALQQWFQATGESEIGHSKSKGRPRVRPWLG